MVGCTPGRTHGCSDRTLWCLEMTPLAGVDGSVIVVAQIGLVESGILARLDRTLSSTMAHHNAWSQILTTA
jgi:flagellar basal body P-ring protein FlgI